MMRPTKRARIRPKTQKPDTNACLNELSFLIVKKPRLVYHFTFDDQCQVDVNIIDWIVFWDVTLLSEKTMRRGKWYI